MQACDVLRSSLCSISVSHYTTLNCANISLFKSGVEQTHRIKNKLFLRFWDVRIWSIISWCHDLWFFLSKNKCKLIRLLVINIIWLIFLTQKHKNALFSLVKKSQWIIFIFPHFRSLYIYCVHNHISSFNGRNVIVITSN